MWHFGAHLGPWSPSGIISCLPRPFRAPLRPLGCKETFGPLLGPLIGPLGPHGSPPESSDTFLGPWWSFGGPKSHFNRKIYPGCANVAHVLVARGGHVTPKT